MRYSCWARATIKISMLIVVAPLSAHLRIRSFVPFLVPGIIIGGDARRSIARPISPHAAKGWEDSPPFRTGAARWHSVLGWIPDGGWRLVAEGERRQFLLWLVALGGAALMRGRPRARRVCRKSSPIDVAGAVVGALSVRPRQPPADRDANGDEHDEKNRFHRPERPQILHHRPPLS